MIRPLLTLCLALLVLCAVASAIPVTGPLVITAPGTYELEADITGTGANATIEIRASGVTFEGNGHLLAGVGATNGTGVLVQGNADAPVERVVVRNLSVRGWQYGVHAIAASELVLENLVARENIDHGIYLFSTSNSTIRNCSAEANRGSGVVISDVSHDNLVEGTTASLNDHNGLMLIASMRNRLVGNTVRGNGAYGIDCYLARENVIVDNRFSNENNTHIEEFDRNTWSLPASPGPNIVGGPQRGGNFWGQPDGRGFSEITPDANGDGFCDTPHTIREGNVDELPLRAPGGGRLTGTATPGFGVLGALAVLVLVPALRCRR